MDRQQTNKDIYGNNRHPREFMDRQQTNKSIYGQTTDKQGHLWIDNRQKRAFMERQQKNKGIYGKTNLQTWAFMERQQTKKGIYGQTTDKQGHLWTDNRQAEIQEEIRRKCTQANGHVLYVGKQAYHMTLGQAYVPSEK